MARAEKVYIGLDNRTVRELTKDGESLSSDDKDAISKVQAYIGDLVCIDTTVTDDPISYSDGEVTMQLGLVSGIEAGTHTVYLTVYDTNNDNGLAWGSFQVEIVDWPTCSE